MPNRNDAIVHICYQITFLKNRLFLTPTQKCFDLPNKLGSCFSFHDFSSFKRVYQIRNKTILIKPVFVMQYPVSFRKKILGM